MIVERKQELKISDLFSLLTTRRNEEITCSELEAFVMTDIIPNLTPKEMSLFMKHFFNNEWRSGFTDAMKTAIEDQILIDCNDYECEELAMINSAAVSSKLIES